MGQRGYLFIRYFILLIIYALFTASAFSAEWPESKMHKKLTFHGKPLPREFIQRGEAPLVALYVGNGTWDVGKEHLKMFFREHGVSYREVTAAGILSRELLAADYSILVMPGGESWEYLNELGDEGAKRIREFVDQGGGYVGICAGAFYATSQRLGGVATGPYGIGLLDGTAYDGTAMETKPFIEGMMDFDFLPSAITTGFASIFRIALLGGPSFRYTAEEAARKHISVLAQFQVIHEPAMILFDYGQGHVFLTGPHLEVEEERTDWGKEWADPDSEWPILERVVRQVTRK